MPISRSSKKTSRSNLKNSRFNVPVKLWLLTKSTKVSQPISEEAIRQRAYELWKAQDERTNSQDNWNEAKRQLEQEQTQRIKGLRKIASLANQPLIFIEKRVIEPCANWFERAAIFQIIEKLSPIIEAIGVIMIPVAIWLVTEANGEVKERQEKAVRGQQAVQSYLNQVSNILLQGGVKKLENDEQLRNITRASTLALFQNPDLQNDLKEKQSLEEDRKGQVISYLSETELITSLEIKDKLKPPIISLNQANLNGANLSRANLSGANLNWAKLIGANLERAYLSGANLEGAKYTDANTKPKVCKSLVLQSSCATKFPSRFDPIAAEMVLVKDLKDLE